MAVLFSGIVTSGSDDSGVGTIAWTNPSNCTGEDNVWATAVLAAGETTHYLKGLVTCAVAVGSTISGIEVGIQRNCQTGGGHIRDVTMKMVKGGTVQGNNNANTGADWPTVTDGLATYGSSSDLWGLTWTVADVNAADFGAVLSATIPGGSSDTARVDSILITIYGTAGAPNPVGSFIRQAVNRASNYCFFRAWKPLPRLVYRPQVRPVHFLPLSWSLAA